MNKKQRSWLLFIILLCISFVLFFYSSEKPKKVVSVSTSVPKNIEKPKRVIEVIVPTIETRQGNKKAEKDCDHLMLEKIAGSCNIKCLADHVKDKDPELAIYIEKERLSILDADRTSSKKVISKLARFYISKYFGLDDKESEQVLRKLSEEDKDNAFPALYHAVGLMNLEKPGAALKVTREALKRPNYTHYVPDMKKRLRKLTVHDPRLFARALIFSDVEIQITAADYLDALWHLGEDVQYDLGKMLVRQAVQDQGKYSLLKWSPADFYFGLTSIQGVNDKEAAQLEQIADELERDLEDFADYKPFNCEEKHFEHYRLDVMERLESIK